MNLYLLLIIIVPILGITLDRLKPNGDSIEIAKYNSELIENAIYLYDEVIIPDNKYTIYPIYISNKSNIRLQIDGTLVAQFNIKKWPTGENGKAYDIINFENMENITITGTGMVDGNGYNWWRSVLSGDSDNRGHMFKMIQCKNILIENIYVKNSPQFHFYLNDVLDVIIRGIDIWVDTKAQRNIMKYFEQWNSAGRVPIFPLNTDGIDPKGKNVHIYNVTIRNYDDAVAVKPANEGNYYSDCTENIIVEDVKVTHSTGMAIGSVPPNNNINCIKNVIFKNIEFNTPFKAVYIKTNPGNNGYGLIQNITYENIVINKPLWYAIYIGPQQQKQPDGSGPGCMLYPFNPDCPTQPRISIKDIHLKDITSKSGLLLPGIIRCNETNPCGDFFFKNVNVKGWLSKKGYICENIYGYSYGSNPKPCF